MSGAVVDWRRAAACSVLLATLAAAAQRNESSVGVPARIEELVLPAPELEVVPLARESPIVLRILSVEPHGEAFRYDLEYVGLEAGEHDLRAWLRPAGGTAAGAELPAIPVRIRSSLPAGQVLPHTPGAGALPRLGGYRVWLAIGAIAWVWGLWALLRGPRPGAVDSSASARPPTLAERLRPLVERALAGTLSRAEHARLELSLVAYWRARLELERESATRVMATLRAHPEAGPLLSSLEEWLHAPPPHAPVDLVALLSPYRDLPSDALDPRSVTTSAGA